ncbi:MAG: hypothetical protein J6I76_21550 [Oribacterium sp.]|nr:hypothetical protein [Oribacterium sp.]
MSAMFHEFWGKYSTKEEREKALKKMTNEEIEEVIKGTPNIQGKIYLSSFKKEN